ncbi:glycosyltransferase family 4 protein [Croceicoccus mobilis]|nr:glycosyltransferase family 4 protein [Croceicoccus mobilis]
MAGYGSVIDRLVMTDCRILFITRKWAPAMGGMETYSMRLSEALAKAYPTAVIALPGCSDGMPPSPWRLLAFPFSAALDVVAARYRPQVLHLADLAIWPLAALAVLCGRPTIAISAHGTDVAYHRRGGIRGRLYGAYLRLGASLLRNAAVIANSHATADVLRETGWHSVVVPLATDIEAPPANGTHNRRLLFAGRLIERKGCGWFIREVLPLVPDEIELDIAGTGWSDQEIAALNDRRVHFLGPLDKEALTAAYHTALAVVVPNIPMANGEYEGFGLVGAEAAAAGGLVLASDCDGLRDAVQNGVTGTLLAPADPMAWANAIRALDTLPETERCAQLARSQAQAKAIYSWDRVAGDTINAYPLIARTTEKANRQC